MQDSEEQRGPVKAKAVIVDPASMTVLWVNEAAAQELEPSVVDAIPGAPLAQAVPMAEILGLEDALRAVAETGIPQHLRANLVSTGLGNLAIVTSVYLLPEGTALVLTENAWQPTHARARGEGPRKPGRHRR